MRKIIHHRDSGLQRPASRPLPEFLLALRQKIGLTQRELGAKLDRHPKFVYDCEAGERRIEVGEFIEWSLACGENPLLALATYGKILGGDWAKTRPTTYPTGSLPYSMLNEDPKAAEAPPTAAPSRKRKKKTP